MSKKKATSRRNRLTARRKDRGWIARPGNKARIKLMKDVPKEDRWIVNTMAMLGNGDAVAGYSDPTEPGMPIPELRTASNTPLVIDNTACVNSDRFRENGDSHAHLCTLMTAEYTGILERVSPQRWTNLATAAVAASVGHSSQRKVNYAHRHFPAGKQAKEKLTKASSANFGYRKNAERWQHLNPDRAGLYKWIEDRKHAKTARGLVTASQQVWETIQRCDPAHAARIEAAHDRVVQANPHIKPIPFTKFFAISIGKDVVEDKKTGETIRMHPKAHHDDDMPGSSTWMSVLPTSYGATFTFEEHTVAAVARTGDLIEFNSKASHEVTACDDRASKEKQVKHQRMYFSWFFSEKLLSTKGVDTKWPWWCHVRTRTRRTRRSASRLQVQASAGRCNRQVKVPLKTG